MKWTKGMDLQKHKKCRGGAERMRSRLEELALMI
jgi:hypothetical protein